MINLIGRIIPATINQLINTVMISFIEFETIKNVLPELDALHNCGWEFVNNDRYHTIQDLVKHDPIIVYTFKGTPMGFAVLKQQAGLN